MKNMVLIMQETFWAKYGHLVSAMKNQPSLDNTTVSKFRENHGLFSIREWEIAWRLERETFFKVALTRT